MYMSYHYDHRVSHITSSHVVQYIPIIMIDIMDFNHSQGYIRFIQIHRIWWVYIVIDIATYYIQLLHIDTRKVTAPPRRHSTCAPLAQIAVRFNSWSYQAIHQNCINVLGNENIMRILLDIIKYCILIYLYMNNYKLYGISWDLNVICSRSI